jgi:hypothetical protein
VLADPEGNEFCILRAVRAVHRGPRVTQLSAITREVSHEAGRRRRHVHGTMSGVSWLMVAMPLHLVATNGGWEWAASMNVVRGLPDHVPEPRPLPTVGEIVAGFRSAGCHGDAWFAVAGQPHGLPPCVDPQACQAAHQLHLGEVTFEVPERGPTEAPQVDDPVSNIGFRKPLGIAVLRGLCAVAATGGSMFVFDDQVDRAFVVYPTDSPEATAAHWPW